MTGVEDGKSFASKKGLGNLTLKEEHCFNAVDACDLVAVQRAMFGGLMASGSCNTINVCVYLCPVCMFQTAGLQSWW